MISWLQRRRWALQGIALVCLVSHVYGLDPNRPLFQYVRESWNTEAKFPGGAVNAIAQTPDGYLWIGTEKGLFRFDGFKFVPISFPSTPSASSRPIVALLADANGTLWVRVQGSDVLRQKNGKFETVEYATGAIGSQVTAISKDRNGGVLVSDVIVGTFRFGVGDTQRVATPKMLPSSSPVISIAETSAGKIWLGTLGGGLFLLASSDAAPVHATFPERKINCLLPVSGEDLLVGTDNGLYHWNNKGYRREASPSSVGNVQVLSLLRDRDSNVWVGTDRGLLRINGKGTTFSEEKELRGRGAINVLFEDREGNLWVGGAHGLGRIRNTVFITFAAARDSRFENTGPIYSDAKGRTLFAPAEGGLYPIKDAHIQPGSVAVPADDVVYSIDGRGDEIWIGRQRGGLTHLQWRNGTVSSQTFSEVDGLAQNSVYSVLWGRDGSVWAGTLNGGVSKFKDGRFTTYTTTNGLASNTISSILETRDGAMWFATPNGLSSFSNGQWRTYTTVDGLPSPEVNCLFEDSSGTLWSGTSVGLAFFASNHFQVPHESPGVLREEIVGMTEDKSGRFWIATSGHVLRVPRDKLLSGVVKAIDVREYGQADGLESTKGVKRSRSVVSDSAGRIWFSLSSGLSVVNPSQLTDNSVPALPHIEAITADNNKANLGAVVQIPPSPRRITLEYTGLSLAVPERIRFRYFLENFDIGWSQPVAAREAVYTNLGPGSYRFRLVASNSEGLWNGPETAITLNIAPAYYQTTWFALSCAAAMLALLYAFYRLRLQQQARQFNIRLEERVYERTRIARELHDTLLQSFQGLMMKLYTVTNVLDRPTEARERLEGILEDGRQAIDDGRDAVRGMRLSTDFKNDLASALATAGERLASEQDSRSPVDFRVVVEGKSRDLHLILRDEAYRIASEATRNAFLHSAATRIEVEICYDDRLLRVRVLDNGKGIDPRVLDAGGREGHFGLTGMQERAKLAGCKLTVRSRPDSGTEVELIIPASLAYAKSSTQRRSIF